MEVVVSGTSEMMKYSPAQLLIITMKQDFTSLDSYHCNSLFILYSDDHEVNSRNTLYPRLSSRYVCLNVFEWPALCIEVLCCFVAKKKKFLNDPVVLFAKSCLYWHAWCQ